MSIKNTSVVYINGINLTKYTVLPLKWGNFLDERLDEMYLALRHCPIKNFKPLSPVEIRKTNVLSFGNVTVDTQTQIKRYIVADDSDVNESPVGKNLYDHNLYIIELTKIAECFVVDTITFTNDLGRQYSNAARPIYPKEGDVDLDIYKPVTPITYVSPLHSGITFDFVKASLIFPYIRGDNDPNIYTFTQSVKLNGIEVWNNEYVWKLEGSTGQDIGFITSLKSGIYEVNYTFNLQGTPSLATKIANYTFMVAINQYPLKKWTMKDVIERVLDLAEPIRKGETPRFRLNAEQAARFDKILAPQFSFTKQTLRECLQQCGAMVHGEPRLDVVEDEGKYYYEVSFDLYGQTERSGIWHKKYIQQSVSQVIDSYASHIDSNAENLVNSLDKYTGVIVEPYAGGYKTVRTDTMYARITDENMIIMTQFPIQSIEKLECGIIPNNTGVTAPIDITDYVFESSIYNAQLSSFSEGYPYSKAYGIMYTQGQKNLTALNFKLDDAIAPAFENYAIVNILRSASGDTGISVSDYPLLAFRVTYTPIYTSRVGQTKVNYQDYPYGAALIYNQQANIIESRYYGENLKGVIARIGNVEKSFTYIIARLSEIPQAGQMFNDEYYISAVSVEEYTTYFKVTIGLSKDFNRLSQYIGISSVKRFAEVSLTQALERNLLYKEYIVIGDAVEADTDCMIGNNLMDAIADTFKQTGDYSPLTNIAAWGSSYQPMSVKDEVSGTINNVATSITFTLPTEYGPVTVTGTQTESVGGAPSVFPFSFTTDQATYTLNRRTGGTISDFTITSAVATEYPAPLPCVFLPVICSAFGNSISFSWEYEDNYSAGAVSQYADNGQTGNDKVSGYFQNNYQYTDYYGKIYYYNFDLQEKGPQSEESFTPKDVTGDVSYQISSDKKSVVFTLPNTGNNVTVTGTQTESVGGSSTAFPFSFTSNAASYTLSARTGGTISSVTIASATEYIPDFFDSQTEIGLKLPGGTMPTSSDGYFSTLGQEPYILRKDNREKLQGNVQIDFVSNKKGMIVGSALASYCPVVRGSDTSVTAKLYVLNEPLNKFIDHLEAGTDIDFSALTGTDIIVSTMSAGQFRISSAQAFPQSGKAWAIVTGQTEKSETVEDEEGNVATQTVAYGGDVLLAMNMEIAQGDTFEPIFFTKKRKIFKEDVWTAIR